MHSVTTDQYEEPVESRGNHSDERGSRSQLMLITLHSVATFFLSYLLVYLGNQLISIYVARDFGIGSTLHYNEVVFHVSTSYHWSKNAILSVSAAGPVISLLIALLIMNYGMKRAVFPPFLLFLLFWTGFHCYNAFFGDLIAGSITGSGLGYTLDLFLWPYIGLYITLTIFATLSMVSIGYRHSRLFLRISPSGSWIRRKNRRIYLLFSLILPWIVGTLVISLIKFPMTPTQHNQITLHDNIQGATMIFFLIPAVINNKPEYLKYPGARQTNQRIFSYTWACLAILAMILFRSLL